MGSFSGARKPSITTPSTLEIFRSVETGDCFLEVAEARQHLVVETKFPVESVQLGTTKLLIRDVVTPRVASSIGRGH
ncbi:hypothetical protein AWC38_SpisGene2526 [Stylophora pistillata]|uniref:Uncharacterized protein n=1 Tax=Stylophora pistillata TaxID=50429 RepID=A0A2B4STY7_STYPI|nr:hypothetical protein AWC38_SpisGene2526 [Stylophora pistillata]